MPFYPHFSDRTGALPGSVYERFRGLFQKHALRLSRLHVGDTCFHPFYPLPLEGRFTEQYPDYNRYCDTFGVMPLREALAEKLRNDNDLPASTERILITGGAVQALNVAIGSLVNQGESVMTLTPCWPFFPGIVKLHEGKVLEVPFYLYLRDNPEMDVESYLESYRTKNTVALYLNTPNNPSGVMLQKSHLESIGRFVRKHQLWLISDEAYDGLTYDNTRHISVGSLNDLFEQTISVFTFSKIYMFAGLRVGYAVATEDVIRQMNKILVHQLYGPTTFAQYMMIEPIRTRHQWMPAVGSQYRQFRDCALKQFRIPVPVPQGTYFFFFDAGPYLQGRDYWSVIEEIVTEGVAVAPGSDFGSDYGTFIRICFTGEPQEKLLPSIETINRILLKG